MAWDFETEPEFKTKLDWVDRFVTERLEPLDLVLPYVLDRTDPFRNEVVPPLQDEVRANGLWACHLGPELGGQGFGQVKLALLNEILGRARCAPAIFGCRAPDSGNGEILARYGTEAQKDRFLRPLLAGEMYSCFSITEPQGGADPKVFTAEARQDGEEWVISGEKWFSSNARFASFYIVMVVTDPEAMPYRRHSMFLVPADSPGIRIIRNVGLGGQDVPGDGTHAYVSYDDVRVPGENMLGGRGEAFAVAQTRLGGGRIHHAMRAISLVRRAFEMMLERVVSRTTQGELLANKQMVQQMIADSWIDIETFRLLVLRTAWRIDQAQDYFEVRHDISAVKALMPKVLHDVSARALQIHGSLGLSTEMPFMWMIAESFHMGLADGPTEVHKATLARRLVSDATPSDDLFPTRHLPKLETAARELYGDALARHGR